MSSNVVKSRNPTVSALAIVLGMYQVIVFVTFYFILSIHSEANADNIPAAYLHVAREEIDAAQAKIDQLTRELEIEQVRRREAEAMCRDATAKLCSQWQILHSLREENIELHSTLTDVTAERDEFMRVMKELAFARAILANDLSANDSVSEDTEECVDIGTQNTVSSLREENIELHSRLATVTAEHDELMHTMKELAFARTILANDLLADDSVSGDTEEHVDIEAKCITKVEKRPEVRFADFVDILVYQQEEEWEEEVTSSCEFFDDDSDGDKSTDSNSEFFLVFLF
jgi:hypothetical protein